MNEWVISLVEGGGYWGILFLMALENIVPPIPSELIMGLAGIAIAHGRMDFLPVLLAGTAAPRSATTCCSSPPTASATSVSAR